MRRKVSREKRVTEIQLKLIRENPAPFRPKSGRTVEGRGKAARLLTHVISAEKEKGIRQLISSEKKKGKKKGGEPFPSLCSNEQMESRSGEEWRRKGLYSNQRKGTG